MFGIVARVTNVREGATASARDFAWINVHETAQSDKHLIGVWISEYLNISAGRYRLENGFNRN